LGHLLYPSVITPTQQFQLKEPPMRTDLDRSVRPPPNTPLLTPALRSLVPIGFILLFTYNAHSEIIHATSCSPAHIQAAVDSAATGDTVQLPPCIYSSWTTDTVSVSKAITIAGAGSTQTILKETRTNGITAGTEPFFSVNCRGWTSGRFEFYGITLQGRGDEKTLDRGLSLRNACKDFLIHHSTFRNFGHAGIYIRDAEMNLTGRGVIYQNNFIDNFRPRRGYGIEVIGDGNYAPSIRLGTENAVFIEDNYFEGNRHCVASNNGSHYVFRYNTIVNNREDAAAIDAHGKTQSWPRGSRTYEIYHNRIDNSVMRWAGIGIRGGEGVIFNNTINGTSHPILLWNDSSLPSKEGCKTYPCPDQITDLYIWNNMADGSPVGATIWVRGTPPGILLEGRDYFHFPNPRYAPFTYPHPLRVESR